MVRGVSLAMVAGASLILLAAGCATMGGKSSEADEAAVRAVLDTYAESVNKGDVNLHASLWDEAAIKHKNGIPAIVGMRGLRERWEKTFPLATSHMVITTQEVIVSGGWAFAHGVYIKDDVPKAGGATVHTDGKFLTVFKREPDGKWRIYADTSSSNVP